MAFRAARRDRIVAVAADEEALPFGPSSFDLVVSNLSLHWANDLPGALLQIRNALKPDGFFLASLAAAGTLAELGEAMIAAESALLGGARARLAPLGDLRELAGLLQRAGFALPVADVETITVTYADPIALLAELRGMGETSLLADARPLRRDLLARMGEEYRRRFAGADGRVPATFRIVYLAGWAPHAGQQQPLRPGSARARLADALGATERPAGEKAGGPKSSG
jgi:SAM-dependent methyltransferase